MNKVALNLNQLLDYHLGVLDTFTDTKSNEFEIRFKQKNRHPLSKLDYDNVIKKLKSLHFTMISSSGENILKIQNEFIDKKTQKAKISNIKTIINGISNIQTYCRENNITNIENEFMSKNIVKRAEDNKIISFIDNDDYNFRIAYQEENIINRQTNIIKNIISNWEGSKKIFRYMIQ